MRRFFIYKIKEDDSSKSRTKAQPTRSEYTQEIFVTELSTNYFHRFKDVLPICISLMVWYQSFHSQICLCTAIWLNDI